MRKHTAVKGVVILVIVVFGGIATGCGWPTADQVRKEFLNQNPACTIVSIDAIEGDSSAIYYRIRFRRPGDEKIHIENWTFLYSEKNRNWELYNIERERDENFPRQ